VSSYPKSINIFGGVISTPLHKQVASHPAVDYVVRDRGELALPALLKSIATSDDITRVKNLTYKDKEKQLFSSSDTYPYLEPKAIPFPYYDLFPKSVGDNLRYIRQNYALGCPFRCSFCTIQTIGRKPGY
jgi:anaerobic magnesium-protoporphyrin IX monomethyl ester cyclase